MKVGGVITDIDTELYLIVQLHLQDLVQNEQRRNQDVPLPFYLVKNIAFLD